MRRRLAFSAVAVVVFLITEAAAVAHTAAGDVHPAVVNTSVETLQALQLRLQKRVGVESDWPPPAGNMSSFITHFRDQFGVAESTGVNATLVFSTVVMVLMDEADAVNVSAVAESIASRLNERSGSRGSSSSSRESSPQRLAGDSDEQFKDFYHIGNAVEGYTPVPVPEYLLPTSQAATAQRFTAASIAIGVIAAVLLGLQAAYGFYHFKGFAFIRMGDVDERD